MANFLPITGCIDCARIEAVARAVAAKAGYNNLKQELVQAVVEFVRWRDVLVSLVSRGQTDPPLHFYIMTSSVGELAQYRKGSGPARLLSPYWLRQVS